MSRLYPPGTWWRELPRGLRAALAAGLGVALALAAASWAVYVWGVLRRPLPESPVWLAFSMTLDLGREQTVPAWWSSTLWLLFGLAAAAAGWLRHRRWWYAVAALAWAASLDEYAELHERLDRLGHALQASLPFELAYAWVLPGVLIAAAIGAMGLILVRLETRHTRAGLILSGVLFLLGAVVLEVIGSLLLQHFGLVTWHFALAYHAEEVLEMVGVSVAIVTVLATLSHPPQPVTDA